MTPIVKPRVHYALLVYKTVEQNWTDLKGIQYNNSVVKHVPNKPICPSFKLPMDISREIRRNISIDKRVDNLNSYHRQD